MGNDLQDTFDRALRWVRLDPEKKFFSDMAVHVGKITDANVRWVATGTLLYSLFSLVEGVGLMFRVSWAGWMAISESAFLFRLKSMN